MARAKKKPARRGGPGRPRGALSSRQHPTCKLTQEIIDQMTEIVARGNLRQTACQRLGISKNTYSKWMEAGNRQLRDHEHGRRKTLLLQAKLVVSLREAEARVKEQITENILEGKNLQAQMWFLERRFSKEFSRNPAAHVDDETGEEVRVDAAQLLADRLAQLIGGGDDS